jgi:hypothetical protein
MSSWAKTPSEPPAFLEVESNVKIGRNPITIVGSKAFNTAPSTVTFRAEDSEIDNDVGSHTSGDLLNSPDDVTSFRLRDAASALKGVYDVCEEMKDDRLDPKMADQPERTESSAQFSVFHHDSLDDPCRSAAMSSKTYDMDDRVHMMELGFFDDDEFENKGWFYECVKGRSFEMFFACLIVVNAGYIAYDTDWQVKNPIQSDKPPASHEAVSLIFLAAFTGELILRAAADRSEYLKEGNEDRPWNVFDLIVIITSWIDETLYLMQSSDIMSTSALRILRVLRLMRVVRVVRVVRFFRDLRVMVFGILNSMKTLSWAVLLLMLIIFVFAVTLVQSVAEELKKEAEDGNTFDDDLLHLYGSLFRAIYTLYCSVCGGLDWDDAAGPLMKFNSFLAVLFCIYVALAVLCVLNIVTGLFVENASKMITRDEDHMLLEELEYRKLWLEDCKKVFHAADVKRDGKIDLDEFQAMVQNVKMQAKLRHLGIELNEANCNNVFKLLDIDGDGNVDLEEFVTSLQQIEGGARALDLMHLMRDMRAMRKDVAAMSEKFGLKTAVPMRTVNGSISMPKTSVTASATTSAWEMMGPQRKTMTDAHGNEARTSTVAPPPSVSAQDVQRNSVKMTGGRQWRRQTSSVNSSRASRVSRSISTEKLVT